MSIIRLLTDFDGRIGRARFWFGCAIVVLTVTTIERLAPFVATRSIAAQITAFAGAFALFPWAALAAKRATDRGSVPLFGILLVCAIVLPGLIKPALSALWGPSLDTIVLIAWAVALVDLGLLPAASAPDEVAQPRPDAKAARWTQSPPLPSPSIPQTPSH
jgi:uncharacterized membrane protein YhaH (DUF805 family)